MTDKPDYYLDITRDLCPMTFVKTKLLVERMQPGQVCEIRLQGAEPLINVPRSIATLGHLVVDLGLETGEPEHGVHRIRIIKVL